MSPKPEEPTPDLLTSQATSAVAGGIDCERLFALMTQQLSLVVDTRRSGKLYRLLQKALETPTDNLKLLQTEGLHWLHRAARHDSLPAIDYLVKLYQPLADRAAQICLRRFLRQRAALRGSADDFYTLALHLMTPQTGLRKNYREASDCLRNAIQRGHRDAHLPLAQLYQRGAGVIRSHEQYLYHLEAAAQAGLEEAQIALARAYAQDGLFVQEERVEYWLSQAVQQGVPEALYLLGKLWYHQDGDHCTLRVRPLWQQAAEAGIPEACYQVGRLLLTDPQQATLRAEAIRYLCQAAQHGVYPAAQLLYRYQYDTSGRYIGILKEPLPDYAAIEQTLF